jgi:hypothetical protein
MHRSGTRLVKMNAGRRGLEFYVIPGGPVTAETAKAIIAMPNVVGGKDGLFPGLDQTWRIIETPQ